MKKIKSEHKGIGNTDDVIVGDYVNATIQIKKYDNGTAKYKITGLE